MHIKLKYVVEDTDRHGNKRLYFRRKGQPKIRLPDPAGSPEFLAAYRAALAGKVATTVKPSKPAAGTMRALCHEYYVSAAFRRLEPKTQRVRRGILDRFLDNDGDGDKPFALLQAKHIRKRRDDMADRPEAANGLVKSLRQLFTYAVEYELVERNPARDVPYISTGSEGFHSWTLDEIQQYEAKHKVGSKARLALALLLYTAQRRSDVVHLGRQHLKGGKLVFTQHKNRNRNPVRLELPLVPELQRIINASPCGDMTFLVTEFNRPFTANGFGNRFRKWCDDADLPAYCSAHGLRKAAAARLAELGCSEMEIMAVTGHRTSKEVTRYTRAASQTRRADSAMNALAAGGYESVPPNTPTAESGTR